MKRPRPVYRALSCHKCGGVLKEWDCYCAYGCDACDIQSECASCGYRSNRPHVAEVETDALKEWKEWCRQRSVDGQKKAEEKRKAALANAEPKPKKFKVVVSYADFKSRR